MPVEIDEVERRIKQLEIERAALRKETDAASKERLEKLERELADLQERSAGMKAHWQREKEHIDRDPLAEVSEIDRARSEAELAERDGDLERAAELRYGRIIELAEAAGGGERAARGAPGRPEDAEGGGRRGGRRRGRLQVDRHPRVAG